MNRLLRSIISICCVLFLLLSFGMHSVQVPHTHYSVAVDNSDGHSHVHLASSAETHAHKSNTSEGTESLTDKIHMAEKKYILFVFGAVLIFSVLVTSPQLSYRQIQLSILIAIRSRRKAFVHILYSYIRLLYTTGILNPKLY